MILHNTELSTGEIFSALGIELDPVPIVIKSLAPAQWGGFQKISPDLDLDPAQAKS